MKYIIIVPDGMADEPLESLCDKTPLEAARTPNMDRLAHNGLVGLVQTIPDGMKPGSDIGNLALLGYDPRSCYSGRAPLEAANLGIELGDNELAFRCNLVTIEDGRMADYSAGHISTKEADELIAALNAKMDEDDIRFVAGKSYRHLMIMKVRNPEDFTRIACVPPHDILGQPIAKHLPQGQPAQALLRIMEKAGHILEAHNVNTVRIDLKENPANRIWLWGQGGRPKLPLFSDRYGLRGGIISAVDLVNGIGRLAGLEVITVPGITGYYDTNYRGKADYALKSLEDNDFVFVHIEGPDEAGHNGDAKAKIHCIEHIDREILGPVLEHFDAASDFRILVLPDHPTPVAKRTHTNAPVGFVMAGRGVPNDGAIPFNERTAKNKGLRFKSGEELVKYFITNGIGV